MKWLPAFAVAAILAATAACGGEKSVPPVTGTLSLDQANLLNDIVRADAAVNDIAGQSTYTLVQLGPWNIGKAPFTGETVYAGGQATMLLDHPILHVELNLRVPAIRTYYTSWSPEDRARFTPYRSGPAKVAVDNLTKIQLYVDLSRGVLAGMRVVPDGPTSQRVAAMSSGPTPVTSPGIPQSAIDLINGDTRLQAVRAGATNRLTDGSAYTVGNAHFAAVAVHFEEAQTLEADWLILFDIDQTTGAYQSQPLHFKAADVSSLSVVVDLDKGSVAWVEPVAKTAQPTPASQTEPSPPVP